MKQSTALNMWPCLNRDKINTVKSSNSQKSSDIICTGEPCLTSQHNVTSCNALSLPIEQVV